MLDIFTLKHRQKFFIRDIVVSCTAQEVCHAVLCRLLAHYAILGHLSTELLIRIENVYIF